MFLHQKRNHILKCLFELNNLIIILWVCVQGTGVGGGVAKECEGEEACQDLGEMEGGGEHHRDISKIKIRKIK